MPPNEPIFILLLHPTPDLHGSYMEDGTTRHFEGVKFPRKITQVLSIAESQIIKHIYTPPAQDSQANPIKWKSSPNQSLHLSSLEHLL